jgi:hypothetical protein
VNKRQIEDSGILPTEADHRFLVQTFQMKIEEFLNISPTPTVYLYGEWFSSQGVT